MITHVLISSLIKDHPVWIYDSNDQVMGSPEGNASMLPVVFKNLKTYSETMQGLKKVSPSARLLGYDRFLPWYLQEVDFIELLSI